MRSTTFFVYLRRLTRSLTSSTRSLLTSHSIHFFFLFLHSFPLTALAACQSSLLITVYFYSHASSHVLISYPVLSRLISRPPSVLIFRPVCRDQVDNTAENNSEYTNVVKESSTSARVLLTGIELFSKRSYSKCFWNTKGLSSVIRCRVFYRTLFRRNIIECIWIGWKTCHRRTRVDVRTRPVVQVQWHI